MKATLYLLITSLTFYQLSNADLSYPIVDTNQQHSFNEWTYIEFPSTGERFDGQDAQYAGNPPSYRDNGDGTISDLVTGLMWTKDPGEKVDLDGAMEGAAPCRVGGYDDWRLPSMKELYSLIQFSGIDPDPSRGHCRTAGG